MSKGIFGTLAILVVGVSCGDDAPDKWRPTGYVRSTNCGNNQIDVGEVCDGAPPAGMSCASLDLGEGELSCQANCQGVDKTGCSDYVPCVPECGERVCGPDPVCGESCGECDEGACNEDGECITGCVPVCGERVCGPDPVCGLSCGECDEGECNEDGECVEDPPVTKQFGSIWTYVSQDATWPYEDHAYSTLSALFFRVPGSSAACSTETMGDCVVTSCPTGGEQPTVTMLSGGVVSLDVDGIHITLDDQGTGEYPAHSQEGRFWSGGDLLAYSGAGSTAPSFSANVVAPNTVRVTSLPEPSIDTPWVMATGDPISLVWQNGGAGHVVAYVTTTEASPMVQVACTFSAAAGTGTIPAGAMSALPAGPGSFMVLGQNSAVVSKNGWTITVGAQATAVSSANKYFFTLVQLEQ